MNGVPGRGRNLSSKVDSLTPASQSTVLKALSSKVYSQTPGVYSQTPRVYSQTPGVYSQTPGVYSQTPGVYSQTPRVYSQTPGVYSQTPRVYSQTPRVYSQTPGVYSQTPGVYSQTPGGKNYLPSGRSSYPPTPPGTLEAEIQSGPRVNGHPIFPPVGQLKIPLWRWLLLCETERGFTSSLPRALFSSSRGCGSCGKRRRIHVSVFQVLWEGRGLIAAFHRKAASIARFPASQSSVESGSGVNARTTEYAGLTRSSADSSCGPCGTQCGPAGTQCGPAGTQCGPAGTQCGRLEHSAGRPNHRARWQRHDGTSMLSAGFLEIPQTMLRLTRQ
jgi:hypothetical protein